jgi:hypothetical protein
LFFGVGVDAVCSPHAVYPTRVATLKIMPMQYGRVMIAVLWKYKNIFDKRLQANF